MRTVRCVARSLIILYLKSTTWNRPSQPSSPTYQIPLFSVIHTTQVLYFPTSLLLGVGLLRFSKSLHLLQLKPHLRIAFHPPCIIKACPDLFSELIAEVANRSFREGVFPSCLKHASVVPLLKKPSWINMLLPVIGLFPIWTISQNSRRVISISHHIITQFQPVPVSLSPSSLHWNICSSHSR